MNNQAIFNKLGRLCEKMPIMSLDYRLKSVIRCPESGRKLCDMTDEGGFEAPLLKVVLITVLAVFIISALCSALHAISLCGLPHKKKC